MTTIKAVRIHEFGDADVLQYEDVERPEPQEDAAQAHRLIEGGHVRGKLVLAIA
jgi:hypothetical protein